MSFVTSSGAIIPQIITQDLFPKVYALDVPTTNIDDMYMYNFGFPSTITQYVDPAIIVTGPQTYEYKYVNSNGVNVILRGTYNDVMSTVDVLNTYPPLKKPCSETNKREYLELYGPGSKPSNVPIVPIVGTTPSAYGTNYINIKMDGKVFSGSGSLIMVAEQGKPLTDAKIILFRDVNGFYQDLGGKIDKLAPNVAVDKDTLFKNAKKETEEESMKLFDLVNPSVTFVDVESSMDNTFYRVYLYLFVLNNTNQLANMYDANKMQILTNFPHNFNESYKETNALALFDYNTFITKLATYNPTLYNTSQGVFQTVTGQQVNVRGRTMRVIAKLQTENKIIDVIRNNKVNNSTVSVATNTNLFNVITL